MRRRAGWLRLDQRNAAFYFIQSLQDSLPEFIVHSVAPKNALRVIKKMSEYGHFVQPFAVNAEYELKQLTRIPLPVSWAAASCSGRSACKRCRLSHIFGPARRLGPSRQSSAAARSVEPQATDRDAQTPGIRRTRVDVAGPLHDRAIERQTGKMRACRPRLPRDVALDQEAAFGLSFQQHQGHRVQRDGEGLQRRLTDGMGQ